MSLIYSHAYGPVFNPPAFLFFLFQYEVIKAERAAQQQASAPQAWQQQGPSTKKPTAAQRIGLTQPARAQ
jgi:hypothetical protein